MARIAVLEESETIRDEADVGPDPDPDLTTDDGAPDRMDVDEPGATQSEKTEDRRDKYIATTLEIQEAFDAVNTLRYSQPTHLAGTSTSHLRHKGVCTLSTPGYAPILHVSMYYSDNAIYFTPNIARFNQLLFLSRYDSIQYAEALQGRHRG